VIGTDRAMVGIVRQAGIPRHMRAMMRWLLLEVMVAIIGWEMSNGEKLFLYAFWQRRNGCYVSWSQGGSFHGTWELFGILFLSSVYIS
jgi:hypothetical protein